MSPFERHSPLAPAGQPDLATSYADLLERLRELGGEWFRAGRIRKALACYTAARALPGAETAAPASFARLLVDYGDTEAWHASLAGGDYLAAIAALDVAVATAHSIGDKRLEAEATLTRGAARYRRELSSGQGNFEAVAVDIARARELALSASDPSVANRADFYRALIDERGGRLDEADRLFRQVDERALRAGWLDQRADSLRHLGFARMRNGDAAGALHLFEQSLDLMPSRVFVPFALLSVGEAHQELGNLDAALGRFREAADVAEELGVRRAAAQIRYSIGEIDEHFGDRRAARLEYEQALEHARAIDFVPGVELIRDALSRLSESEGTTRTQSPTTDARRS